MLLYNYGNVYLGKCSGFTKRTLIAPSGEKRPVGLKYHNSRSIGSISILTLSLYISIELTNDVKGSILTQYESSQWYINALFCGGMVKE